MRRKQRAKEEYEVSAQRAPAFFLFFSSSSPFLSCHCYPQLRCFSSRVWGNYPRILCRHPSRLLGHQCSSLCCHGQRVHLKERTRFLFVFVFLIYCLQTLIIRLYMILWLVSDTSAQIYLCFFCLHSTWIMSTIDLKAFSLCAPFGFGMFSHRISLLQSYLQIMSKNLFVQPSNFLHNSVIVYGCIFYHE